MYLVQVGFFYVQKKPYVLAQNKNILKRKCHSEKKIKKCKTSGNNVYVVAVDIKTTNVMRCYKVMSIF